MYGSMYGLSTGKSTFTEIQADTVQTAADTLAMVNNLAIVEGKIWLNLMIIKCVMFLNILKRTKTLEFIFMFISINF